MGSVRLGRHDYGYTLHRVPSTGDWDSLLVQTDYDYPGTASTFGWSVASVEKIRSHAYSLPCEHCGTDGTIACPDCGTPASAFISAAAEYLDEHIGDEAADPGYWA